MPHQHQSVQNNLALRIIRDQGHNGASREALLAAGVQPATIKRLTHRHLIAGKSHRMSNPAIDVERFHVNEAAFAWEARGRERAAGEGRLLYEPE